MHHRDFRGAPRVHAPYKEFAANVNKQVATPNKRKDDPTNLGPMLDANKPLDNNEMPTAERKLA